MDGVEEQFVYMLAIMMPERNNWKHRRAIPDGIFFRFDAASCSKSIVDCNEKIWVWVRESVSLESQFAGRGFTS